MVGPNHRIVDEQSATGGIVVEYVPIHDSGKAGLRLVCNGRAIAGASFAFLRTLLHLDDMKLDPHLRAMAQHLRRRLEHKAKNQKRFARTFWSGARDDD